MVATPYPLPRSARRSDILAGNGGTTYGPFGEGWAIFDLEDVRVWVKRQGDDAFLEEAVTVTKTDPAAAWSTFSVTFAAAVTAADIFYVEGSRTPERSAAVNRGGQVDSQALERELTKIAIVGQETRRDVNDGIAAVANALASVSLLALRVAALEGGPVSLVPTPPDPFFMVCDGQSNMKGNELADTGDKTPDSRVKVLNPITKAWDVMTPGVFPCREATPPYSAPNNPAFQAAKQLAAAFNIPVYVVFNAVPSTEQALHIPVSIGGTSGFNNNFDRTQPELQTAKVVASVTAANPVRLGITGHGYSAGDVVQPAGLPSSYGVNGNRYLIDVIDADTIALRGVNGTGFAAYVAGGTTARVKFKTELLIDWARATPELSGAQVALYLRDQGENDSGNGGQAFRAGRLAFLGYAYAQSWMNSTSSLFVDIEMQQRGDYDDINRQLNWIYSSGLYPLYNLVTTAGVPCTLDDYPLAGDTTHHSGQGHVILGARVLKAWLNRPRAYVGMTDYADTIVLVPSGTTAVAPYKPDCSVSGTVFVFTTNKGVQPISYLEIDPSQCRRGSRLTIKNFSQSGIGYVMPKSGLTLENPRTGESGSTGFYLFPGEAVTLGKPGASSTGPLRALSSVIKPAKAIGFDGLSPFNRLDNGDFHAMGDGWNLGTWQLQDENTGAVPGSRSIINTDTSGNAQDFVSTRPVYCQPGDLVGFNCRYKTSASPPAVTISTLRLLIEFYDKDDNLLLQTPGQSETAERSAAWSGLSVCGVAPANTAYALVRGRKNQTAGSVTISHVQGWRHLPQMAVCDGWAIGDGVANDSNALQAVLTSGRSLVLDRAKTYLSTSRLTIGTAGTGIEGNGASILMSMAAGHFDNSVFANRNGGSGTAVYAASVTGPFLNNVKIRPSAWTDVRYLRAVYFDTCTRPKIMECDFRNFSRGAGVIGIKDCTDPVIRRNVIEDIYSKSIFEADGITHMTKTTAQLTAIEFDEGASTGSKNLDISDNTIRRISASAAIIASIESGGANPIKWQCDGINIKGTGGKSRYGRIARNHIENVNGEGIDGFGYDIEIVDNTIIKPMSIGIKMIHGATRNLVSRNTIINAGACAIGLSGSDNVGLASPADGNRVVDNVIIGVDPKEDWTEADGTVIFSSSGGTLRYYVDGPYPDLSVGIQFFVAASATSAIANALVERNHIDLNSTGQRGIFHENVAGAATSNRIGPNTILNVASGGRKIQDSGNFLNIERQPVERYELAAQRALASNTSAQDIFDKNYTAEVGEKIRLRGYAAFTVLSSSSSTISFGVGGTATVTEIGRTLGKKGGGVGGANMTDFASAAALAATSATTSTAGQIEWDVTLLVTVAGTIKPQMTMGSASSSFVEAGSWQSVERIGIQNSASFT